MPTEPVTVIAMCPGCGIELICRLTEITPIADEDLTFAYVYPVHPKPGLDFNMCEKSGVPLPT